MRFEFATAQRIVFGRGVLAEVGPAARAMGRRGLLVCGKTVARAEGVRQSLEEAGIHTVLFSVDGEPTTDQVKAGAELARRETVELVVGYGGGSVLDTGKAIAALLTNGGELLDYLEVIGKGQALAQPSAPYIALPTTAGTGAEVTRNAVLGSPPHRLKVSLRSPHMLPRLALVDPLATVSMPPSVTAGTGLDALTQCLEPFVSNQANPITDTLCREGMARAARSLRTAYYNGSDLDAREDMALASLMGGLALANAKLGAVHGFAGVLGGRYDLPHGATCARLLPFVMEANLRALDARQPQAPARGRYDAIAQILTGSPTTGAAEGVAWVHALCEELKVPRLRDFGVERADLPVIVELSAGTSSMKGNPVALSSQELTSVLELAL